MSPIPLERCYDCGKPVPEDQLRRREVSTGSYHVHGHLPTANLVGDRLSGGGSTHTKVSLYSECETNRQADDSQEYALAVQEQQAAQQRQRMLLPGLIGLAIALFAVPIVGFVAVVILAGG